MKKKIVSILSIILFISLICNITYASETNVTLQKNKEKYTGGDVVEISVKVNDITLENGIETIIGKISYNKDLYESCVIEANNNWEADYNEQNGKIILQRNEAIKENHTAFVIKLTIKDNIVNNDTISFADINIADENTDLFPQNATTSITIENPVTGGGEEPEGEQQPEIPSGNQGSENTNTGTNDKSDFKEIKEDNTKTENKMPNTGADSVIRLMTIVAVFGIVCLVKYNKYRQI
jgi:hypothetical protein